MITYPKEYLSTKDKETKLTLEAEKAFNTNVLNFTVELKIGHISPLPIAKVESGVKYAKWLSFDSILTPAFVNGVMENTGAVDYYQGNIGGKPKTIFFYFPFFN